MDDADAEARGFLRAGALTGIAAAERAAAAATAASAAAPAAATTAASTAAGERGFRGVAVAARGVDAAS